MNKWEALRGGRTVTVAALAMLLASTSTSAAPPAVSAATTPEQAGMLDVATLAPGFSLDMRYAGEDNFTGRPVPGYEAPRCYLLAPAAQALARVQRSLQTQGLALRLYDCYRPVQSVQSFMRWVNDPADQLAKARYYPNIDKRLLVEQGYIAEYSGHSRAATVDLGLLDCRNGECVELDMGTGFDRFDTLANTDNARISERQRDNRRLLLHAMRMQGFANYPMEWWHYTFKPEPTPDTAYDFPVR